MQLTPEELKEEEHKKKVEAKAGRVTHAFALHCFRTVYIICARSHTVCINVHGLTPSGLDRTTRSGSRRPYREEWFVSGSSVNTSLSPLTCEPVLPRSSCATAWWPARTWTSASKPSRSYKWTRRSVHEPTSSPLPPLPSLTDLHRCPCCGYLRMGNFLLWALTPGTCWCVESGCVRAPALTSAH